MYFRLGNEMKRNFQWILCFGILALFVPSINANSAEFSKGRHSYCAMHLDGQIEKGDLEKYKIAAKKYHVFTALGTTKYDTICLNSNGGSLSEALLISKYSLKHVIGTVVAEDEACLSACALIFMTGRHVGEGEAGLNRKLHFKGTLGLHRPSIVLDRSKKYNLNSVELAFDTAIDSVIEFIKIGNIPKPWSEKPIIPADLLKKAFERKGNNFYYIDDINKIGRWDIEVIGIEEKKYPKFSKEQAWNVCENTLTWQSNLNKIYLSYRDARSNWFDRVRLESTNNNKVTYWTWGSQNQRCRVQMNLESKRIGVCGEHGDVSVLVGTRVCIDNKFNSNDAVYVKLSSMLDPRTKLRDLGQLPSIPNVDVLKQCTILDNGKIIDKEICHYTSKEKTPQDIVEFFEWPSGSKTVLETSSRDNAVVKVRINDAVTTEKDYSEKYGSCYPNSKTGNQFCYLALN